MATSRTTDIAELQQKLDVAGDDIALINMRLDKSQGMYSGQSLHIHCCDISMMLNLYTIICMAADGAAAVQILRAELARAKEQA